MFNNNKAGQEDPAQNNTYQQKNRNDMTGHNDDSSMNVISERSEIIGTLKSRRNIKIAGKVDGGVEAEGKVIVASTGLVEGSINSKDAYIAGKVEGDIHATEKLTLASSAVAKSDLYTPSLSIEEGAVFNGVSHMEIEEENDNIHAWETPNGDSYDEEFFDVDNEETDGELTVGD
jgi:cytoskeletal protein CcmA (bactofilin family)